MSVTNGAAPRPWGAAWSAPAKLNLFLAVTGRRRSVLKSVIHQIGERLAEQFAIRLEGYRLWNLDRHRVVRSRGLHVQDVLCAPNDLADDCAGTEYTEEAAKQRRHRDVARLELGWATVIGHDERESGRAGLASALDLFDLQHGGRGCGRIGGRGTRVAKKSANTVQETSHSAGCVM